MEHSASVRALKGVVTGIATVSRLTRRGGGAVIGGKVALALDKSALAKLAGGRPEVHVVANCDDPLVVWAAEAAGSVTWVSTGQRWRIDATSCPNCGGRITWTRVGDVPRQGAAGAATDSEAWACSCGLARPE